MGKQQWWSHGDAGVEGVAAAEESQSLALLKPRLKYASSSLAVSVFNQKFVRYIQIYMYIIICIYMYIIYRFAFC